MALQDEPHIQRVWLPYQDSPGLAMSRAFGDFMLKSHGVIAIPEVSSHQLSPKDQFLVLATDGVWPFSLPSLFLLTLKNKLVIVYLQSL